MRIAPRTPNAGSILVLSRMGSGVADSSATSAEAVGSSGEELVGVMVYVTGKVLVKVVVRSTSSPRERVVVVTVATLVAVETERLREAEEVGRADELTSLLSLSLPDWATTAERTNENKRKRKKEYMVVGRGRGGAVALKADEEEGGEEARLGTMCDRGDHCCSLRQAPKKHTQSTRSSQCQFTFTGALQRRSVVLPSTEVPEAT